jgi:REP element-mobilizing transposase RayT
MPARTPDRQVFRPVSSLRITRRDLPHIQRPGSTYFVTFCTAQVVLPPAARQIVLGALHHWNHERYDLRACVIMPDHVHAILTPLKRPDQQGWYDLGRLLHGVKSWSANAVNRRLERRGPLWQPESFDRVVRSEREMLEKWSYVRANPWRAGLVPAGEGYPFLYEGTLAL